VSTTEFKKSSEFAEVRRNPLISIVKDGYPQGRFSRA
jgi:hypothetical protein